MSSVKAQFILHLELAEPVQYGIYASIDSAFGI